MDVPRERHRAPAILGGPRFGRAILVTFGAPKVTRPLGGAGKGQGSRLRAGYPLSRV